ncbi:MAG: EAL domain-containing protein, partial [Fibrobacteraceae bacterium]
DVKTERLIGAEALIRWNYQGQGILLPGKFVPVFEEDGSIAQLDRFVFRSVCEKMKEWQDKKYPLFPVSVNLSRVQLNNTRLVEELMDIVHQCGIPISMIDVELTESAAFGDMGRLLQVMNSIKQGEFRLSMDDFGTGYSSLSLLKDMPLDTLKLDKSFIDALDFEHTDAKENIVTKEIVVLTKRLHIGCLAEGVETKEQRDLLAKYGCDFIQGYYYSKPVPAEEYEKILLRGFVKTEAR